MKSLLVFLLTFLSASVLVEPAPAAGPEDAEFFEKHVRPILAEHCFSCHGPSKQKSGLRLDSRSAVLKGGNGGPVVVAGDPEKSALIQAIRYSGEVKMPPKEHLPAPAVEALTTWVRRGLPWPDTNIAGTAASKEGEIDGVRRSHWAFRPVQKPPLPGVQSLAWVQSPIDTFVLNVLEAAATTPAKAADKRTLLRRATFDLVGLPPTPAELAAFEADQSPEAFARVVDRLLASPRYGERWGRYWLDVARYADTKGYVFTEERRFPYAYTYRDYVIRAFNTDLPYDRFIVEQLAADSLPLGDDHRPLAAMGYLTLGRRFLNNAHDIIDDRIDVVSRGLLGLTVGCARCHDHKFDPIPTKDYYSLYGVFASSVEPNDLPLVGMPEQSEAYAAFEKELQAREQKVKEFLEKKRSELASGTNQPLADIAKKLNRKDRDELTNLRRQVEAWKAASPAAPPRAMVLQDQPVPQTPHVFLRGNPSNSGPEVPRQFLEVLAGPTRKPFTHGSGRLDLAEAIASQDNPLAARVLVNRVWLHHFGAGIVRTPSDFGTRGEPPTHPALLDWLAATFMENGWSIKRLHRTIMLSATYKQAADVDPATATRDPENRLLSHQNRRRLDFEALRDSLLAVSGRLEDTEGGRAVELTATPSPGRRTVYGFIDRQNLPGLFRTFDFASPDTSSPQRFDTTVPQQALFLLNSPFVEEQARALVGRPDVLAATVPPVRIERLYRLLYGRAPDRDEVELGLRFLKSAQDDGKAPSPWQRYAQVLLLANEFSFVD